MTFQTLTGSIPVSIVNENSKYASNLTKRAGPPPGRKVMGAIDVIGGEREGGAITVSTLHACRGVFFKNGTKNFNLGHGWWRRRWRSW